MLNEGNPGPNNKKSQETRRYSLEEVAKHNKVDDAWIIIDGVVYDITKFAKFHPGGTDIILDARGTDASKIFWDHHHQFSLEKYKDKLKVGYLTNYKEIALDRLEGETMNDFGSLLPYTEPHWYQGQFSPYYKETHAEYRKYVRNFIETVWWPATREYRGKDDIPRHLDKIWCQTGMPNIFLGMPWNRDYNDIQGPENFDLFHQLIVYYECARQNFQAFQGVIVANAIGLPPIFHFGSDYIKDWILPQVLKGEKRICLAISEPFGASDVSNLRTIAKREGDFYIINGQKKWITGALHADYFTTAVRTGKKGMSGLSMILIEKNTPGFRIKPMQSMNGEKVAYLIFENCKVPVKNIIGEENGGFMQIMYNFNQERLAIIITTISYCRQIYKQALQWSIQRESFGKKMHNHQSVRMKLANMARKIEELSSWTDQVTYQLTIMEHFTAMRKMGDQICLLKVTAGQTFEFCARECAHIFGGSSLIKGGPGQQIEHYYGTVLNQSLTGGSEDVLLDFGARQLVSKAEKAMKKMSKMSKI